MTSPEAPGLLTEAAGEWCARPQWWWTAGLGGARPGHRWAVGHCRPGQPTATAGRAQATLHCRPELPTMEPTADHPPRSSDQQIFC